MWSKLHPFFSTLFGERHEEQLLQNVTTLPAEPRIVVCNRVSCTALCYYAEPIVRAAIHEAKFFNNQHAQHLLGAACAQWYATQPSDTLLVPLPLSRRRLRERGFNQVAACLDAATLSYSGDILSRTDRPPQTTLSKHERLTNVQNCFQATHNERIRGRHIILIDDVITTGATMAAARAELSAHQPASISCLAFAH